MKKTSLWDLFWTFFKIGAFTFGGGWSLIGVMEEDVVNKKHWVTQADVLDMLVISESTPGVIAVNMATSIGYRQRGVLGGAIATIGVVLPSVIIISALSFGIEALENNVWYKSAFYGIQVGAIVLIANAFLKLFKQLTKNVINYIMMVASLLLALFTDINVIFIIIAGAVLGILINCVFNKKSALPIANAEEVLDEEE